MPLIRALLDSDAEQRTAVIAESVGMVTKTAALHLDDLALIGIADRRKETSAINSPHLWKASDWLREHWPEKVRTKTTTTHMSTYKEDSSDTQNDGDTPAADTAGGSFRSYFPKDAEDPAHAAYRAGMCRDCGIQLHSPGRPRCEQCHHIYLATVDGYNR